MPGLIKLIFTTLPPHLLTLPLYLPIPLLLVRLDQGNIFQNFKQLIPALLDTLDQALDNLFEGIRHINDTLRLQLALLGHHFILTGLDNGIQLLSLLPVHLEHGIDSLNLLIEVAVIHVQSLVK